MITDSILGAEVAPEQYTPFVDSPLLRSWLDALRSGKYAQGQRFLRTSDDNYCCLGVLCNIVEPDAWVLDGAKTSYSHLERSGLPYYSVLDGICATDYTVYNPVVKLFTHGQIRYFKLSDLNDRFNFTFEQIADVIENNILEEPKDVAS